MNQQVVIKLDINGAYFQKLLEGKSKNPQHGYSVATTLNPQRVRTFKAGSKELHSVVSYLQQEGIGFVVLPV